MKRKLAVLSQQYLAALKQHLKHGTRASLEPASGLGRQAMALDLDTLDVGKIHEEALATLPSASINRGIIKRAELFFAKVINPIETLHPPRSEQGSATGKRAEARADDHLSKLVKTLGQRTVYLAVSNWSLKQNVVRQKIMEATLKKRALLHARLLKESLLLQKRLQQLARKGMTVQEDNRTRISHDLQNEIAQSLLAINVHLITLKKEASVNAQGFKNGIASTQRLVEDSVRSIYSLARELDLQKQT